MLLAAPRGAGPEPGSWPGSAPQPFREPPRSHPRVLVVEGDRNLCRLLGRLLTRAGYRPLPCEGVEEAREALLGGRVDLVLCDALLPGTKPLAFLAEVERFAPGIPVLLMSGRHDADLEHHGIDPARVRLRKPFGWNELVTAVQEALA